MPIVKNAEQIGTVTLEDGRVVPKYNVKTETTITNIDTGKEYESEEAMQADIDDANTKTSLNFFIFLKLKKLKSFDVGPQCLILLKRLSSKKLNLLFSFMQIDESCDIFTPIVKLFRCLT